MKPDSQREEALVQAALRLGGAERAAFLDGACQGDSALRQRLDALLAANEHRDSILKPEAPPPGGGPSGTIKLELNDQPDEAVGQTLGRYKLLERLGEGGCGVVYVAEQTQPVRRRVALKIIKLGMDTKQVVARFEAERQALAMMDHPNIAKVLDGGTTETGRPYFVMELVRGIRITDYCDQANLTTQERLDLFIKVCQAIQHAHQKGIIHRDIKPSNILVTLHDGVPVPKVIDFGIAKATEGRLTDNTVYTQLNQFIGTPAYMSPEQAEMSGLDIDTRSDIYSLGVLLYELLSGSTPFDPKELMASGLDAMRRTIREQEPPRPSTRLATLGADQITTTAKRRSADTAKLLHQLRGDLDWIVMKCLEKDRQRRYNTASGLAADLTRHLSNEPVLARPPTAAYRFQKTVRRHKVGFVAATLVTLVLVLGIVGSTWQAVRATKAERKTAETLVQVAAERDAKEQARKDAEEISKFLGEIFQSPDPARDGRTVRVVEVLDTAAKKLDTDLAAQPARRAKLQLTLGYTYGVLGLYPQAISLEEKARDYYKSIFGPEHPDTLRAMRDLARNYHYAGRRDEALKLREEVLSFRRKLLGPEHPDTLMSMKDMAGSYSAAGRRDEALKMREKVLPLCRKVFGPDHPSTLGAMGELAYSYSTFGRWDEALKLREEVLLFNRKVLGPEHPGTIGAMGDLALSYADAGRWDEALKLREEVLSFRRKLLGPEHIDTFRAMGELAFSYYDAGRRDEALKLREEVLSLSRKVLGPEHPDTVSAMIYLASFYHDAGRRDEALKMREEGMTFRRKVFGPEHPGTLNVMSDLASSYYDAGRRDEALKLREEVLSLRRKVSGEQPGTLKAIRDLAISYRDKGETAKAEALEQEAAAKAKAKTSPPASK